MWKAFIISFVIHLFVLYKPGYGQKLEKQQIQSYQTCHTDGECKENAFCFGNDDNKTGKCKCRGEFEMFRNYTHYECMKPANLSESCTSDFQCMPSAGSLAICDPQSNTCQCKEMAHPFSDGVCYNDKKLTEYCQFDANCLLSNGNFAFCTDGVCTCPREHRPAEDLMTCVTARPLGQSCTQSDECSVLVPNSYCSLEKICKCRIKYVLSRNESACLPVAIQLGYSCTEDGQCSAFIPRSQCLNNICSCAESYHTIGNRCILSSRAGDVCDIDEQCIYHKNLTGNVKCEKKTCKCIYGRSDDNSFGCVLKVEKHSNSAIGMGGLVSQLVIMAFWILLLM